MRDSIATLKNVGDSVSTEYRVRHDNGDIVHVMGNVKLIESDGELLLQRYLLDYTDKKKEEVRKERRQRDLIQALSEDYLLVCSFSLDTKAGEALRVSGERLRKLDELFAGELNLDGCLGGYIDEAVVDEDKAMLREALSAESLIARLAEGSRIHVNYRINHGDATEYCQATVVRGGDWPQAHNVVLGLRSVDVQTREEMKKKALLEEALTQANKANAAKSAFLSNMSHDIRTPMNAIVGFTTLAASRLDQPEKVEEYLNKIKSSSTHLLSLINDILDMSHIESGKVSLDEQPYNLVDLLDDLYSIIQAETSARQLYFSINTESVRHTEVRCDKLRINQILLEPAGQRSEVHESRRLHQGDAGRAARRAGRLRALPLHRVGHGHWHAPGVRRAHLRPLRARAHLHHQRHPGHGLGMAITKNLVDMMHGTISVKSTQGKGTSFTVELTLQLACEGATAAAQEAKTQHVDPSHRLRHSRILLVDDNDLNREIAITLLEDEGFTVEYAVNGCEAVEKIMDAPSGHYQLVLMDVQMPVMNGYEATKAIRRLNDPTRAQVPILAMTADAFEEDRQKALRSGMNGHLTKPVEIDKLFEALDEVLS